MWTPSRRVFLTLSLTTVVLLTTGRMVAEQNRHGDDGKDSLFKYLTVFTEVFSLVDRSYVDELDETSLLSGALEGALDALDPFSLYIPAEALESFTVSRAVGIGHSGLRVLKERGVAFAAAVVEGSPAAAAGIERGNILSLIQGRPTRQMPLYEIQELLAGAPGTEIEIERLDQGQKETVHFVLGEYPSPETVLSARRGLAVLRLPSFDDSTVAEVETSLETLAQGSADLPELSLRDKLLLDLRGIAGGSPEVAYRVAGLFAGGELGALLRRGRELESFEGGETPRFAGEIAVLVDRGTQGAAEVLATVLRQAAAASLVGETSFGHSGRLGLVELEDGSRLQLTEAFYTGPDREPINHGLEPDLWVRRSFDDEADAERDEVLEQGLDHLLAEPEAEEEEQEAA